MQRRDTKKEGSATQEGFHSTAGTRVPSGPRGNVLVGSKCTLLKMKMPLGSGAYFQTTIQKISISFGDVFVLLSFFSVQKEVLAVKRNHLKKKLKRKLL